MATAKKTTRPIPAGGKAAAQLPQARTATDGAKARKAPKAPRPAKAVKPPKPADEARADKPRKPKLVRDSFTIPKDEYAVLEALKQRAAKLGRPTKKSEVLRAGVQALAALTDSAFLARIGAVPAVKTGRPAKA